MRVEIVEYSSGDDCMKESVSLLVGETVIFLQNVGEQKTVIIEFLEDEVMHRYQVAVQVDRDLADCPVINPR